MSGTYYGDFPTSHTAVCMVFDSFSGSTGAPSATSNFVAGDIQIYKDGGTTQRSSSNGITVSTSFDTSTGLQMIVIDLSDNTDSGFYAAGHEYSVAVSDVTIDSQTMRFWLGSFSIERAGGVLALLKAGTAKTTLADGVAHGGTLGSSTATLALSRLNVTSQTSNTSAITATGNGTGYGIVTTSGSGATGDGFRAVSAATNGHGFAAVGSGTGNGMLALGGASAGGDGIEAVAGGGTDIRAVAITGTLSTVTTYTGNTPQTGDTYALANGASGFAAIAGYIDTEVAAIKAKTDSLTFTVAGKVDSNPYAIAGSTTAATNLKFGALGVVVSTCAAGSTTTSIVTNLTEATDDHYNGAAIVFTSGALLGQRSSISDYVGATKTLTVVALTEAPADTDGFVIV